MELTLQDHYNASYLAANTAAFFSKFEILKLLEVDDIEPVQRVHNTVTQQLQLRKEFYDSYLVIAKEFANSAGITLPDLPEKSRDYSIWLDTFHRTVMGSLPNESLEEYVFMFGYDYGDIVANCDLLRFVTELEVQLPMQLSYRKQTDHLVRDVINTQHRLETLAKVVALRKEAAVLWEQWNYINALIEKVKKLSYGNVEHDVLVQQDSALGGVVKQLQTIHAEIISKLA